MNNPNFGSILDKTSSEVDRPKALPAGTYVCVVNGLPRQDKSTKKGTEYVEFSLKILAPTDSVDQEALQTALARADGSVKSLQEQAIRATYYLTEDALWRLTKFLDDDLQIEEEGQALRQKINEAPGRQVLATLRHKASDDGQTVYAELASTAPVE